jgi:uncharacterized protein
MIKRLLIFGLVTGAFLFYFFAFKEKNKEDIELHLKKVKNISHSPISELEVEANNQEARKLEVGKAPPTSTPSKNIHNSAYENKIDSLRSQVRGGISVDIKDEEGMTPLMHALHGECWECVDFLLKENANIQLENIRGETVLTFSVGGGHTDLSIKLLEMGANPNHMANLRNYSLLMEASFEGNLKTAKALLKYGARLNQQDSEGKTPLIYAAKEGWSHLVKFYLEEKADIQLRDGKNQTALDYAIKYQHIDSQKLLKHDN